jgi:hypothetical protein
MHSTDYPRSRDFATNMLEQKGNDNVYLSKAMFSYEATFHLSGYVNKQIVWIWRLENPHSFQEHEGNSSILNVWCRLMHSRVIGLFCFAEQTVTTTTYHDMLENFTTPQVEDLQPTVIFQQDVAPPHWSVIVREFLDKTFPNCWIGPDIL